MISLDGFTEEGVEELRKIVDAALTLQRNAIAEDLAIWSLGVSRQAAAATKGSERVVLTLVADALKAAARDVKDGKRPTPLPRGQA